MPAGLGSRWDFRYIGCGESARQASRSLVLPAQSHLLYVRLPRSSRVVEVILGFVSGHSELSPAFEFSGRRSESVGR